MFSPVGRKHLSEDSTTPCRKRFRSDLVKKVSTSNNEENIASTAHCNTVNMREDSSRAYDSEPGDLSESEEARLKQEKSDLQNRITQKEETLRKLKMVKMYRSKVIKHHLFLHLSY